MFDLSKFASVPVTIVKKTNIQNYNVSIPEFLVEKSGARVMSVFKDFKTIKYLNSFFSKKKPDIPTKICNSQDQDLEEKKVIFCDYQTSIDVLFSLVNQENIESFSILIINDIQFDDPDKIFLILLWSYIFKNTTRRPYLLITTNCYLIPNLPFELSVESFQEIKSKKESSVEIKYHDKNYTANSYDLVDDLVNLVSDMDKDASVSDDQNSIWMIFYFGTYNLTQLTRRLSSNCSNETRVFLYSSLRDFNFLYKQGKRSILIMDQKNPENIFLNPDGIFDTLTINFKTQDSHISVKNCSKQTSELRKNYCINGFNYRFCTEDFYETLSKTEVSEFDNSYLDSYFLKCFKNNIKPEDLFSPLLSTEKIEKNIERLKYLDMIDDTSLTEFGKLSMKLPIKLENVHLLMKMKNEDQPIFPVLVAILLSEIDSEFVNYPSKNFRESNIDYKKRKTKFLEEVVQVKHSTAFELYLRIFLKIIEDEKTLDLEDIKRTAIRNSVDYKILKTMIENLKNIIEILPWKIKLGLYDPENLIHLLSDYYEISDKNNIGILQDEKRGFYSFPDGKIYKINFEKHPISEVKYPVKIIAFEKSRHNTDSKSLQRGKNIIHYYSTLSNIYIEE